MTSDELPTEWLRAVLPLAVLSTVADGETYGYLVAQHLKSVGLGTVKGGTLYPVLNRLEADGLLVSSWRAGVGGPGRKFFEITPLGAQTLHRRTVAWHEFTEQAASLLPEVRSRR